MDEGARLALRTLADRSRLRIVELLAGGRPMSVEQLSAAVGLTPSTVVHHLNRLRAAGLVESRPRRPYVDYTLRRERLGQVAAALARLAAPDG